MTSYLFEARERTVYGCVDVASMSSNQGCDVLAGHRINAASVHICQPLPIRSPKWFNLSVWVLMPVLNLLSALLPCPFDELIIPRL